MQQFGFTRAHRILRRAEFLNIFATGRRMHGTWVVVYALERVAGDGLRVTESETAPDAAAREPQLEPFEPAESKNHNPQPATRFPQPACWRVGITATRKLGGAVKRNRARRQVREFMRLRGPLWPANFDFAVNLKPAARDATTAQLHGDLEKVFRRLGYLPALTAAPEAACAADTGAATPGQAA